MNILGVVERINSNIGILLDKLDVDRNGKVALNSEVVRVCTYQSQPR